MAVTSVGSENGSYSRENSYDSGVRERRVAKLNKDYPEELQGMPNSATDTKNRKRMAVESAYRTNEDIEKHRSIKSSRQDRIAEARNAAALEQQRENADIVTERHQKEEQRSSGGPDQGSIHCCIPPVAGAEGPPRTRPVTAYAAAPRRVQREFYEKPLAFPAGM